MCESKQREHERVQQQQPQDTAAIWKVNEMQFSWNKLKNLL